MGWMLKSYPIFSYLKFHKTPVYGRYIVWVANVLKRKPLEELKVDDPKSLYAFNSGWFAHMLIEIGRQFDLKNEIERP